MNGKMLTGLVVLLAICMAFLVSAPVFSGEHPWDSDFSGGGNGGGGNGNDWPDDIDTTTVVDTSIVTDSVSSSQGSQDGETYVSSNYVSWYQIAIQIVAMYSTVL